MWGWRAGADYNDNYDDDNDDFPYPLLYVCLLAVFVSDPFYCDLPLAQSGCDMVPRDSGTLMKKPDSRDS